MASLLWTLPIAIIATRVAVGEKKTGLALGITKEL
jgi:hypothetical protein